MGKLYEEPGCAGWDLRYGRGKVRKWRCEAGSWVVDGFDWVGDGGESDVVVKPITRDRKRKRYAQVLEFLPSIDHG